MSKETKKHPGTQKAAIKKTRSKFLTSFTEMSHQAVGGIDVHKEFFNICIIEPVLETRKKSTRVRYHHKNFPRDEKGLEFVIKLIKKFEVQAVAVESTSIYHQIIVTTLQKTSITVMVINAGLIAPRSRRIAKADKLDARKLAELVYRGELSPTGTYRPSYISTEKNESQLRMTVRLRDKLMQDRTRLINRIHKVFDQFAINLKKTIGKQPFTEKWIFLLSKLAQEISVTEILEQANLVEKDLKKVHLINDKIASNFTDIDKIMLKTLTTQMETLTSTINDLDAKIKFHIKKLPQQLIRRYEIAQSLPGIAEELGIRIVLEYGDPFRFTNRRKAGRYTGLDTVIRSSGGKATLGRISKNGNKYLRRSLFIAAGTAVKYDHNFRLYYHKMKKYRKLKHNQILCNVARKLGVLYVSLAKRDELYHPMKNKIKFNVYD